MFPFKRIFNFEPGAVARMEQRLDLRYTPGATFPLQAWLIAGSTELPAKLKDISGHGVSLAVTPGNVALEHGQPVKVRLRFGAHQQLIEGSIAHLQVEAGKALCGIRLAFADFTPRRTYLQLLQPVAIGQSLRPVPEDRVTQNEPQFVKQVFRGEEDSALTVWRGKDDAALHSFEFQMHDYFCHVDGKSGVLEAYQREDSGSHKGKLSNPVFDISGSLHAEIRQLFHWILPNLAPEVPDDVRAFLQRFAA